MGCQKRRKRQDEQLVKSGMDHTWAIIGVNNSPKVTSSKIHGEEDQVGLCEQLGALSLFNPSSTI